MKLKKYYNSLFLSVILSFIVLALVISLCNNRFLKRVDAKDDSYKELRIFSEAINYIENNYVDEVNPKELIYGAIKGMLKDLDPHSSFMNPDMFKEMQVDTKGRFEGIGIEITIKDEQLTIVSPIEETPAFKAGLKAGDFILKIDSVPTRDMSLSEAANRIRGPKGTEVTLTIWREGFDKPKEYTITRGVVKMASVTSKRLEPDNIGYLRIRQFQENTAKDVENALNEMKPEELEGLIIDIRFNAGGLLNIATDVADLFLPKGLVIVSTKGKDEDQNMTFNSHKDPLVPNISNFPIIVLVNAGSASASEILAGALKDWHRAVILGTKTFGKGSVQTIYPLEDGSALRLTTAKYYTPNGTSIHGEGISPDIVVENLLPEDKKRIVSEEHVIREEDLIEFDNKAKMDKDQIEEDKTKSKNGEEQKEKTQDKKKEGDGVSYIEDLQLQRAVDIIKATHIFRMVESQENNQKKAP